MLRVGSRANYKETHSKNLWLSLLFFAVWWVTTANVATIVCNKYLNIRAPQRTIPIRSLVEY